MKIIRKLTIAALLAVATLTVNAGMQTQTDTNNLAAASTNTFKLAGDATGSFTNGATLANNTYINASQTAAPLACAVGGFFTNTTAAISNVTFVIAETVDFANWTNASQTVTLPIPAASTNWQVRLFTISNPSPGYSLRAIQNPTPSGITALGSSLYFKAYSKNGL